MAVAGASLAAAGSIGISASATLFRRLRDERAERRRAEALPDIEPEHEQVRREETERERTQPEESQRESLERERLDRLEARLNEVVELAHQLEWAQLRRMGPMEREQWQREGRLLRERSQLLNRLLELEAERRKGELEEELAEEYEEVSERLQSLNIELGTEQERPEREQPERPEAG